MKTFFRSIRLGLGYLVLALALLLPFGATATLSPVEKQLVAGAQEGSTCCEREHIVLIWPNELGADGHVYNQRWDPERLADYLEMCYRLAISWFGFDPNERFNAQLEPENQARLIFIHNGKGDYRIDEEPRPLVGMFDMDAANYESWLGNLLQNLLCDFLMQIPEITGKPENSYWDEALCGYLRYWLLLASGR